MTKSQTILEQTPPLHKWLGRQLSRFDITQKQLATYLGRSNSQVNHWLAGKEAIPHGLFLQAVNVAIPQESRTAEQLLFVHERTKILTRDAVSILSNRDKNSAFAVAKIIATRAEESAAHCDMESNAVRYQFLSEFIGAGITTLNMIRACQEENTPFIHADNIRLHLRFPHNVMSSDLIQVRQDNLHALEETRRHLLKSMARTLKDRKEWKDSIYVKQHAIHMLARSGSSSDRSLVLEMTASSKDLPTRRTAHYARIINETHPLAADEFIYDLDHEPALAATTLEFDLVHYGDKQLDDIMSLKSVENAIVHNLRHVQSHQRAATAQVALHKLLNILNCFGAQSFDRRRIFPRIRTILENLGSMDHSQLTAIEKKFLSAFYSLQPSYSPTIGNIHTNQLTFTFS